MKTRLAQLSWPLVIVLAVFALVRPLMSITGVADHLGKPLTPIVMTVVVSAVWLIGVLAQRSRDPLLTLVCTGLVYAVLSIVLSAVLSPVLNGQLEGPLATPGGIGVVMVLAVNAAWGAVVGAVAVAIWSSRQPSVSGTR